jgi:hypothetical protein
MKKLSFKSLIMLLAVVVLFNGVSFAQVVVNAIQDAFDSFPSVGRDGRGKRTNNEVRRVMEMVQTARAMGTSDFALISDLNAMYVGLQNDRALRGGICALMAAAAAAVGGFFVMRSADNLVKGGIQLHNPQVNPADMFQYLNLN